VGRQGWGPDAILEPYNEHPIALPMLLFKGLFETVGLAHYAPYQALILGAHVLCSLLLFEFARRRVGSALAVVPALLLLVFGPGWENILWPTQIVFGLPLAAAIGALLLLEHEDPRSDLAAGALLVAAFASGSLGVPIAIGIGTYLLLGDNRWVRLLRVVGVPAGLYAAWLLAYSPGSRVKPGDQLASLPGFLLDTIGGNIASLLSVTDSLAWPLAIVFALLVAWRLARGTSRERMLFALVAMALAYWILLGLFRPHSLASLSRYLYPGALFLLLISVEVARGARLRAPALAVAYALTAVLVVANVHELDYGADRLREYSDFVGSSLAALELASDRVDPDYRPEPLIASDVVAGPYLSAVAAYGSPAAPPDEVVHRSTAVRREADVVLTRALSVEIEETAELPAAGCRRVELGGRHAEVRFTAPGLVIRAGGSPVTVRLRRFADDYGPDDVPPEAVLFPEGGNLSLFGASLPTPVVLVVEPGESGVLRVPADGFDRPWHAKLWSGTSAKVCSQPSP
jgi:hypothetical protein